MPQEPDGTTGRQEAAAAAPSTPSTPSAPCPSGTAALAADAVSHALARLSAGGDPQELVRDVLRSCAAISGADTVGLFQLDVERSVLRQIMLVMDGDIHPLSAETDGAGWRNGIPLSQTATAPLLAGTSCILWADLDDPPPDANPEALAWHRKVGHRRVAALPLVVGGQVFGILSLCYRIWIPPDEAAVAHCRTLAEQAALAIRLACLMQEQRRLAVAEERNRMAREIHDTLAQGFAAILINLKTIARERHALSSRAATLLDMVEGLARRNLMEARRSVQALRPGLLEGTAGLGEALRALVEMERIASPIHFDLEIDGTGTLPDPVEDEMLRIAQEAVTNAVRHGRPRRIIVALRQPSQGPVILEIADDGVGFTPGALAPGSLGMGLFGMRERADRIGADLTLVAEPDLGTRVIVAWQAPR
ncbi:MAG: hypothetical protein RLY86_2928 [Pseudomonadota bacterium]